MTTQETRGAVFQPTEKWLLVALGAGLAALGVRGGPGKLGLGRLALAGTGLTLAGVALRGENPLATALKVRQNEDGEVLARRRRDCGQARRRAVRHMARLCPGLPKLMKHLKRVEVLDERRSRWTVEAPAGYAGGEVSWEAEMTADQPGRRIAWRSLPGAAVENSGEVLFRPAPGDRGTEVIVRLTYPRRAAAPAPWWRASPGRSRRSSCATT